MKHLLSLLCVALILAACNSNTDKQQAQSLLDSTVANITAQTNYYKHFTGTVAGQPVTLNLMKTDRLIAATYYYTKQGKPISLCFMPDTTVANGYIAEEPTENIDDQLQPQWKVIITADAIKGKWISADKKKTYDIDLKEEYPDGSYPLVIWEMNDSVRARADKVEPKATVYYQLLHLPEHCSDKDIAAFVVQTILKSLGADSMKVTTMEAYTKKGIESYSKWYKESMADLPDSELSQGFNNYYSSQDMSVLMNDNGWLIFETGNGEYTGGAHGMYNASYLNIDVQSKKLWTLEDILTVDSVKLQTLLEAAGRKYYNMPPTTKLEENFLVDRIMPNGNIYITGTGIMFVYNQYEIASYAQGVIPLFIPYAKINDLLKPGFKQRMGLR
jgi:hypothetical protein